MAKKSVEEMADDFFEAGKQELEKIKKQIDDVEYVIKNQEVAERIAGDFLKRTMPAVLTVLRASGIDDNRLRYTQGMLNMGELLRESVMDAKKKLQELIRMRSDLKEQIRLAGA